MFPWKLSFCGSPLEVLQMQQGARGKLYTTNLKDWVLCSLYSPYVFHSF